jgi:hypothetical protein
MINALTADLEESYHATAFADAPVPRASQPDRAKYRANSSDVGRKGCRAFMVGSVGKQFPRLIRRVAAAGREIACHSFTHRLT